LFADSKVALKQCLPAKKVEQLKNETMELIDYGEQNLVSEPEHALYSTVGSAKATKEGALVMRPRSSRPQKVKNESTDLDETIEAIDRFKCDKTRKVNKFAK